MANAQDSKGSNALSRDGARIKAEDSLRIVDATKRIAAIYLSHGNLAAVTINNTLVAVRIVPYTEGAIPDATKMAWAHNSHNYFASANCSGPPIVYQAYGATGFRPAVHMQNAAGEVTVHIGTTGPASMRSYQSMQYATAGNNIPPICVTQNGAVWGWNTESTAVLTSLYPEPLTLELR